MFKDRVFPACLPAAYLMERDRVSNKCVFLNSKGLISFSGSCVQSSVAYSPLSGMWFCLLGRATGISRKRDTSVACQISVVIKSACVLLDH